MERSMSTIDDSGNGTEQHSPPMAEAGCEDKIDRSVQGTDLRSGFAELRARVMQAKHEAHWKGCEAHLRMDYKENWECLGRTGAFHSVLQWLDAIEADAKDASTGS
jgi:hypothetical protein